MNMEKFVGRKLGGETQTLGEGLPVDNLSKQIPRDLTRDPIRATEIISCEESKEYYIIR